MGNAAIRVEGVSKRYRIYTTPGDRLKESLTRGRLKRHREFWALEGITFDVEEGTTTGIIGPNGSGKSTLLQIIAGTLEPTHGSVLHSGRVAALLELGAGFNPDFTGLENVFMNAAIMNLSRAETERLLPAIERFAEIGAFLHQPVRTYSSGMYVRLAFAIAVSVDPRILIVDEALSVGDAVFQHRCLRRIKEMQSRGATILFVSHDPGAIRALCSRAILLNGGKQVADGKPPDVLNRYQRIIMSREDAYQADAPIDTASEKEPRPVVIAPLRFSYRHGDGCAEVINVEILDATRRPVGIIETCEPILVRLQVRFRSEVENFVCGFLIRDRHGIHVYGTNTEQQGLHLGPARPGDVIEATFAFNCYLAPGNFNITVAVHSVDGKSYDWLDGVLFFQVTGLQRIEGVANLNATASARYLDMVNLPSGDEEITADCV